MNIAGYDEIDNRLLTLLQEDARKSFTELAAEVGLSRIAVKNRIAAMEEVGLIKGYKAIIAPKEVDGSIEFMVTVCPRAEHYDYVLNILGKSRYITKVLGTTGECKILAFGIAPNTKDMDEYYRKVRRIFSDVRYFAFDVIASTYKDVDGGIEYEECTEELNGSGT